MGAQRKPCNSGRLAPVRDARGHVHWMATEYGTVDRWGKRSAKRSTR
ncbi:MAG TPA: hypothetical protein VE974_01075 [Thermoanaerobaculia bacterium]|nr:hypothetical protein [Thermoanaerobaculia bacterium]